MSLTALYKAALCKLFTTKTWLTMKLMILFTVVACLQVSARGEAQTISITGKNLTLEKVFKEIRKQTGYEFIYRTKMLDKARTVDLDVKNSSIEKVLEICFAEQPFTYTIIDKTIVIKEKPTSTAVFQPADNAPIVPHPPPVDIRGRIVDEKGRPVIATVTIKGTNKAVSTNENGEFELKGVDDNAMLVISGVSIETFEVKVNGRSELALNAKMRTVVGEEVVIEANTGYQKVKPNEVTGSVVVVDNKLLNQQTGTNILERLNHVTSGLYFNVGKLNQNPQNKTNISIRGLSTINGPLDPLIVLDNFIYEGDINNINPNDVESITVLKDAAASSIWGSRAGNGVIVIVTKKGKFNQKLKIGFTTSIIIGEKPDLFYPSQIAPADAIDVEQWLFGKGFFNAQINNSITRPALTPAVEIFLKRRNGQISAADSASQINALKAIDSRDQFENYFYQKAITQQYALNLNGGSNNIAWLISGAVDKAVSNLKAEFDKINLRFVNTYKVTKNLQIDAGVYYTNSKSTSGLTTSFFINNRRVPYLQFADNEGNPLPLYLKRAGYIDTVGTGKLLDWKFYPLDDYKHDVTTTRLQEIIANVGLRYQLIKNLQFAVNYQYQKQTSVEERLADLQSFYARDLINDFAQINYSTGVVNYIVPRGAILSRSNAEINSQNFRGQFDFKKTFTAHSISAIAGGEIREAKGGLDGYRYYGYNSDPLSYASVDYRNSYIRRTSGSPQFIPGAPLMGATTTHRFVSIYSNASYTYLQKYSIYGSLRRDAANVFGAATNDKWKPLWSVGASWELAKESFYKLTWLPYLRLRTTYGFSGNVDPSKTPLPVSATGLTNSATNFPFQVISTPNNPLLRWEKLGQLNIGVDFSTKGQIISGSVDYYRKKGTDLYGATAYDYTSFGRLNIVTKNVASMSSKGLDVTLKSININKGVRWVTTLLYNNNHSETTAYFTKLSGQVSALLGAGTTINPVVGYPLYAISAYKWGGLNNAGDPQGYLNKALSTDYNNIILNAQDSGMNGGSIVYMGPASPTNFGSLMNEIRWKGFSASFNISYAFGYYFRKPVFSSDALINGGSTTADYSKRWQQPGDELKTNVPALVYTNYPQFSNREIFYGFTEINVLKADNIRLQYVNLAYELLGEKVKMPFEQLQLFVNAANLGILWRANKENLDPDYPSGLPVPKSYTIGLRANF